jgi:hypothetical protein
MPFYKLADGTVRHMKLSGRSKPPAPCVAMMKRSGETEPSTCEQLSGYLCDYPISKGKTCDRPLCDAHATEISKNRHYCPDHRLLASELNPQMQLGLFGAIESKGPTE